MAIPRKHSEISYTFHFVSPTLQDYRSVVLTEVILAISPSFQTSFHPPDKAYGHATAFSPKYPAGSLMNRTKFNGKTV
jgi:hypothetical protein